MKVSRELKDHFVVECSGFITREVKSERDMLCVRNLNIVTPDCTRKTRCMLVIHAARTHVDNSTCTQSERHFAQENLSKLREKYSKKIKEAGISKQASKEALIL